MKNEKLSVAEWYKRVEAILRRVAFTKKNSNRYKYVRFKCRLGKYRYDELIDLAELKRSIKGGEIDLPCMNGNECIPLDGELVNFALTSRNLEKIDSAFTGVILQEEGIL